MNKFLDPMVIKIFFELLVIKSIYDFNCYIVFWIWILVVLLSFSFFSLFHLDNLDLIFFALNLPLLLPILVLMILVLFLVN